MNTNLEDRKYWHANGQLRMHAFYQDGQREGECKYWYENGQTKLQQFYRNGKMEGKYHFWRENGQIISQYFCRNGKLEGEQKDWQRDGQLNNPEYFKNGKPIDDSFNQSKKHSFLRLKKRFLIRNVLDRLNSILIPDLGKIVIC
jgi:antitoxin component YwqK of YwqJK toxin-antitoxin module